ncbi:hypothetical protein GGR09_001402 [Bartonella heixiaziensis]
MKDDKEFVSIYVMLIYTKNQQMIAIISDINLLAIIAYANRQFCKSVFMRIQMNTPLIQMRKENIDQAF